MSSKLYYDCFVRLWNVHDVTALKALEDSREILIQRNLIKYDKCDPKRTAPKYSIVLGGKAKVCRIPVSTNEVWY